MSKGAGQEETTTTSSSEVSGPPEKMISTTDSEALDDSSTKATEENDSDDTMGSAEDKKESSDAETEADDTDDAKSPEEKEKETKEKEEAEKKRIEELKEKYKDWPLKDIKEPHENDVMYGRGGGTNHHPGNKRYRKMVEDRKVQYVNSKRLDKPLVALEIIREWRAQLPPGRFLKHNDKTGSWDDVGDKKAREKTSQALREKAPIIRAEQEKQLKGDEDGDKTTRFAAGTKGNKKSNSKVKKAILARDHSLGREYLATDENVDLEGFTWVKEEGKQSSMGSVGSSNSPVLPAGRENSVGSVGTLYSQQGWGQQPPAPDFHGRVFFDTRREMSNSSLASFNQPYMPVPPGGPHIERSGSWTHPAPPTPPHGMHHQRSGSWNNGGGGREHSFSLNPLQHTNINRPAPTGAFDQRPASGSWGPYYPHPGPPAPGAHPPPPPPAAYPPFAYQSGSSMGTIGSAASPYRHPPPQAHTTPSPPYDAMGVARTWSQGGSPHAPGPYGQSQYEVPVSGVDTSPQREAQSHPQGQSLARPGMIKRDTSNQNESYETKPSRIKKAALNRDQSATSNRLKQQFIPEVFNKDMQSLNAKTEQIRLTNSPVLEKNSSPAKPPKPQLLDLDARQTTVDAMEQAMTDFLFRNPPAQPNPLSAGDRQNTMDELGYDLVGETSTPEPPPTESLAKPAKLEATDRLTTTEFNEIINAPFPPTNDDTDDKDPLPL